MSFKKADFLGYDRARVAKSFSLAAKNYDKAAILQREVGNTLLALLNEIDPQQKVIVDLGCGTGRLTFQLAKESFDAKVIGIDIADKMIEEAKKNYKAPNLSFLSSDAHNLPFPKSTVNLFFRI
jgi:Methylase involved in ubiquinone/menaquinone biosynthesis